jgi:Holliday junction resolvasome RuvABC endonuclease subunit
MAGTLQRLEGLPLVEAADQLREQVAAMAAKINTSILALDLANHTGYAVRRRDGKILHGVENFSPRASWSPGQRWQRFRSWLAETIVAHNINAIAYEVVIQGGSLKGGGHKSGTAGDVYGGFKAVMEMVADSHRLEIHPVYVATVKKTWTGNHQAKKPDMVAQAKARGFRVEDDNEADALAILHWAMAKEAGTWTPTPKRQKPKTKRAPKAQGALL